MVLVLKVTIDNCIIYIRKGKCTFENISFKTAKNDIIAGIIVALVSIPISMGMPR